MRRITVLASLLFSLLFLASIVGAAEKKHVVEKGECLWRIAEIHGVNLGELKKANPKATPPRYVIYPGQILAVSTKKKIVDIKPVTQIERSDEAGFGNELDNVLANIKAEKAKTAFSDDILAEDYLIGGQSKDSLDREEKREYIDRISSLMHLLNIPEEVKEGFLYEIYQDSSVPHSLKPGDRFEQLVTKNFEHFRDVLVEADIEVDLYFVESENRVNCLGIDDSQELYFWTISTSADEPSVRDFKNGWKNSRNYDLFGKAGGRNSRVNTVTYYGGKFRATPINVHQGEGKSVNVGAHVEGIKMHGKTKGSDYSATQLLLGPSAKMRAKTWESTLDVGVGVMKTEYEKGAEYRGSQDEKIFRIYSHTKFDGREKAGKKFFPQAELGIGYTHPFGVEQSHSWEGVPLLSKPYDNRRLDVDFTQWLYRHEEGNVTVYPGVNIGGGRIWGHDTNYGKLGVAVKAQYQKQDIASANVGWQEEFSSNDDGVYWNIALHFKGVYKFLKSLSIQAASPEDLHIQSSSQEEYVGDSEIVDRENWDEEVI